MSFNWRKGQLRSQNAIEAHPQRLVSANGSRWATGRNVKRSLGDGRYDAVEVWTLKVRVDGKAVTVESHVSREAAEAWILTNHKVMG